MKKVRKIKQKLPSIMQKKRVAAYARVSRESQEMAHSLAAQIDYYTKLIANNPEWELVDIYADYGISGTGMKKRADFNRMLADAKAGKIDLIITKSIQRFARNTVDLLNVVRDLKDKDIEVYFEKERIYSLSGDGELMLTLLASFAQEESRSISENVKWSIRKKYEEGTPHIKSRLYGYRWEGNTPVIVEEEAVVVRRIYQNFVDGKTRVQSAKELNAEGITTWKGNEWDEMAIRDVLMNPMYAGNLLLQKCYTESHLSHKKVRNKGQMPMYLVKEDHEAIISQELFDWVQKEIMDRRVEKVYCKNPHLFTKKIVCGKCGCFFIYCKARDCWMCNSRDVLGQNCHTISIPDKTVMELCSNALNGQVVDRDKIEKVIVYEDYRVTVVLKDGSSQDFTWSRPPRKWKPEDRERILESRRFHRRKGLGRYCEFTSRIFTSGGEGFRRFLKPNKKEGTRAYWRVPGISIKENNLRQIIQQMMGWEEYQPQFVVDQIDEIQVSKAEVKLQLFSGEVLCQER